MIIIFGEIKALEIIQIFIFKNAGFHDDFHKNNRITF